MSKPTHEETLALIARAQSGDREALSRLTEQNAPLVRCIVGRFTGRGERDDLFQLGCIGLIKAIRHYDASYQVRFSTYAVPLIAGEIKRFLRDDGTVKISRSIRENAAAAAAALPKLRAELGREPRLDDVAAALGLSREETVLAVESNAPVLSLQKRQFDDDDSSGTLADAIPDPKSDALRTEERIWLKEQLSGLDPRSRTIIFLHYFMDKTQTEIAGLLGISQVQVSRIESRILQQIRKSVS
ncbi:MAG: sigma-70 family RNA polymerase sigma factor [Eubacteriales bacterium]|nr:sigma-70 family RNA polymerase sigma factor [Eubacteriales bacterium]